jgi:diguanylate cyclase (GGDEF)-like protein
MYGHDEVYIYDHSGKPIYSLKGGEELPPDLLVQRVTQMAPVVAETRTGAANGLAERVDAFAPQQERYNVLAGVVLKCGRWRGHVLSVDGRPAVVAGISICPTVDAGLLAVPSAMLISVVYVDEAFVTDMGQALLLPDLRLAAQAPTEISMASEPFITDENKRAGFLIWTPKQPGHLLLKVVLPLAACGVIGAGLLAAHMLRRLRIASGELAEREAIATYQANHDSLSGLPNRQNFAEQLRRALRGLDPGSGRGITVAYIDIDRFKDINDTLGHHAGDQLIKAVATRLSQQLGSGEFLARFGGDEFAILRGPMPGDVEADWVASLMASFAMPLSLLGQNLRVTASVGLAHAPDHGTTPDELMRNADIALYAAKARGRDQAVFFSKEMAEDVLRRRSIETNLREAIGSDQLTLHYQPIISCESNTVVGVEALLRWRHPTEGDISPGIFIPIAEEFGLMPALGLWVLDRAFADSKRWPDLEVAINLSPAQFHHLELEPLLTGLIRKHRVEPHRIVLEITEGFLLENSTRIRDTLDNLRKTGFKLALDDFGTGYSGLNYLHKFQFDKLKIDRSFMRNLSTVSNASTIVQTVIKLGRSLGMDVIAEGVETESEAAMMRLFGCAGMQGFLFSAAVPPEEVNGLQIRPVAGTSINQVLGQSVSRA